MCRYVHALALIIPNSHVIAAVEESLRVSAARHELETILEPVTFVRVRHLD